MVRFFPPNQISFWNQSAINSRRNPTITDCYLRYLYNINHAISQKTAPSGWTHYMDKREPIMRANCCLSELWALKELRVTNDLKFCLVLIFTTSLVKTWHFCTSYWRVTKSSSGIFLQNWEIKTWTNLEQDNAHTSTHFIWGHPITTQGG